MEDTGLPTLFGLHRTAILQIIVFLSALLLADHTLFSSDRFFNIYPHPFWIIVLLITTRYGTREGLIAAGLSSAALLVYNLPPQLPSQDTYVYLLHTSLRPLLWLAAATILGEIQLRHKHTEEELRENLLQAHTRERTLTHSYERLKALKKELEIRITSQFRTAIQTYHAAKSVERLDPAQVILGIESLIKATLNPQKFSIYLLRNNRLENVTHYGWKESDDYLRNFGPETPLFQEIIGRQHCLTVINQNEEMILGDEGLMAAPLLTPEFGQVLGMIKIEKTGFSDLNLSTIEEFKALCDWIALSYANAKTREEANNSTQNKEQSRMGIAFLSHGYFERQMRFLTALAKRLNFPMSMITIRLVNLEDIPGSQRVKLTTALHEAIEKNLRVVDQSFERHEKKGEFAVLLPNTPAKNAQIVIDKVKVTLEQTVHHIAENAKFSYTVQALYDTGSSDTSENTQHA